MYTIPLLAHPQKCCQVCCTSSELSCTRHLSDAALLCKNRRSCKGQAFVCVWESEKEWEKRFCSYWGGSAISPPLSPKVVCSSCTPVISPKQCGRGQVWVHVTPTHTLPFYRGQSCTLKRQHPSKVNRRLQVKPENTTVTSDPC